VLPDQSMKRDEQRKNEVKLLPEIESMREDELAI
jgi:hypothetical protein